MLHSCIHGSPCIPGRPGGVLSEHAKQFIRGAGAVVVRYMPHLTFSARCNIANAQAYDERCRLTNILQLRNEDKLKVLQKAFPGEGNGIEPSAPAAGKYHLTPEGRPMIHSKGKTQGIAFKLSSAAMAQSNAPKNTFSRSG